MHVALIKLGALGDVVRTTSLVPGLKRLDPAMELTWITDAAAAPLVGYHGDVRFVRTPDEPGAWRETQFDWVISLDDSRVACHLASLLRSLQLSGAYRAADGSLRYTPDLEAWFGMGLLRPEEEGGLAEANRLKQANTRTFGEILFEGLRLPGPVERPLVQVPPAARVEAGRVMVDLGALTGTDLAGERRGPVVALNTGAGGRWKYKSWGEEQTAQLAARLHDELGATVLVAGGVDEVVRNARIVAAADRPHVLAAPVVPDLLVFTALLGRCDAVVTSDSLAMHLSLSQGVRTIAFFGPTSDAEIDLFGLGEKVATSLPCRRCYLADCDVRPHCMESIGVARLFDATARWLARPRWSRPSGPAGRISGAGRVSGESRPES
ncbi:MAG TPA: glycosyltransferase family 9 protein [Gemmatimonadales bacterium]|nr:glycosyltransferase family 9 protein [Gemmatimonadales bacterium]